MILESSRYIHFGKKNPFMEICALAYSLFSILSQMYVLMKTIPQIKETFMKNHFFICCSTDVV